MVYSRTELKLVGVPTSFDAVSNSAWKSASCLTLLSAFVLPELKPAYVAAEAAETRSPPVKRVRMEGMVKTVDLKLQMSVKKMLNQKKEQKNVL